MLFLKGEKVYIRPLRLEDVSMNYVNWMNDSEINQYLESRNSNFKINDLKEFVKKMNSDNKNYLFGIFDIESEKHIGNIKIGNINTAHKRADVGLVIGDKSFWGKGIATEAIMLVTMFAFDKLNLNKLFAGMYSCNIGSFKAFIKAGYQKVAHFKNHSFFKGHFIDSLMVEIINSNYQTCLLYEKYRNNTGTRGKQKNS